jgi:hypothetical protein
MNTQQAFMELIFSPEAKQLTGLNKAQVSYYRGQIKRHKAIKETSMKELLFKAGWKVAQQIMWEKPQK